jgi:hypothetical protein
MPNQLLFLIAPSANFIYISALGRRTLSLNFKVLAFAQRATVKFAEGAKTHD